jgi:TIR domain
MTERSAEHRDFFISRAGENSAVAVQIADILRGAGYSTFIQDRDFGSTDFMARMAEGFAMVDRGARLIALLSHHYQKKPHCMKEAHYPLTDDPSNKRERLIALRVGDCIPEGNLKGIPYVDLVPLLLDAEGFARAVRGRWRSAGKRRSCGRASTAPQNR